MAKREQSSGFGIRLTAHPFSIYQAPSFLLYLVLAVGDTAMNKTELIPV